MIGTSPDRQANKIHYYKGETQNEKERRQNRKTARHRRNDCGHHRRSRRHDVGEG